MSPARVMHAKINTNPKYAFVIKLVNKRNIGHVRKTTTTTTTNAEQKFSRVDQQDSTDFLMLVEFPLYLFFTMILSSDVHMQK